jgi:acyl-CoA reductase-like NAD-dependent aldehyde dehydrogenase
MYPTLLDYVRDEMRVGWEEPFESVIPNMQVFSDEKVIKTANESHCRYYKNIWTIFVLKELTYKGGEDQRIFLSINETLLYKL